MTATDTELRGQIAAALYDVLDDDYAVHTLALLANGRFDWELDPMHDGAIGIYDCDLARYVAVVYLDGHPFGVDVETTDAFLDVLDARIARAS
jgi:hypothetical protein